MEKTSTVVSVFFDQVEKYGSRQAFYYHDSMEQSWQVMNWREYGSLVKRVALWLQKQGIQKGDRVAILSANRPEWIITDLAIMSIGAVSVPIYATSSEKDVRFIAEHSDAKLFFVDCDERARVLKGSPVQTIVLFDPCEELTASLDRESDTLFFWKDLVQQYSESEWAGAAFIDHNDLATIVYTSGTTGQPKGVMHSVGNLFQAMETAVSVLQKDAIDEDRFFSFLPLSHVAERVLVELGSIGMAQEVAFARSVSSLGEDLQRCRPTILLCVPRLWEKMYERIQGNLMRAPLLKRSLFQLAYKLGRVRCQGDWLLVERNHHWCARLSDLLVGKKLRAALGLDRARLLITGSAPTRREVMEFFASWGLIITEAYGLTENLCLGAHHEPGKTRLGTCGKAFEGNQIRIAEDGEILFKAPWNFCGYFKNKAATQEAFTEDGWLKTGDLGVLDEQGYLSITGRKKELLKTSTGKYVAPVPIEDAIKSFPGVIEAIVIGDNQKYCIAMVALEDFAQAPGVESDLLIHIKSMNKHLANHEAIKRIGILKDAFSVEDGTLTPTLKLKRKVIEQRYAGFIETIYSSSEMFVYQK